MRREARPWVAVAVVAVLAVGAGAATIVQSVAVGSAHRELAGVNRKLSSEEMLASLAIKELVATRAQVRTLQAEVTATTIAPTSTPITLTDPQLLVATFDTVAEQLMGAVPPEGQRQEFVSEYQAIELHNAQLRIQGQPSVALDPTAEATAFINKHDQAAVIAYGAGSLGQTLNCMIILEAAGCQGLLTP